MDKKVCFGVIGCGTISPWHINGILKNSEAKLVAVADENEEKAKKIAEKYNAVYYTDYKKLLEDKKIDAVCLCTPSSLHSEQAILAARAGKHVLTEKPMAINLEDADKMIYECRKANVKLGVIFQRRTDEIFIRIKKAIDNNELGKIVLGDIYMKYYRSQEYYDSANWRGTWKYDGGGALMNQGIHIIDLIRWYIGPVDTIFGFAEHLVRKIEVEDTAVAVLKFKNGALGVIEGTTSVYPPTIPHRIEIHGEKGTIIVEGEDIIRWDVMGSDGNPVSKLDEVKKETTKPITSPTDIGMEGHRKQIADFIESIKTGKEPVVNGEEGRKSLEIILAIYESAKTKLPVKL